MVDDYRQLGDVTPEFFLAELERVNSPMLPVAPALYMALKGHTRLALAHMWRECQYETDRLLLSPDDHNPFNLRPNYIAGKLEHRPGATGIKHGYLTFDSYTNAAREWRRRTMDDPTYKKGIYTTVFTLEEYIETYAPTGDAHPVTGDANESYYRDMVTILTRFAKDAVPVAVTFKKYTLLGFPAPVVLPSWIVVEEKIINSPRFRSFQKRGRRPKYSAFHDTGNGATGRQAEYNWGAAGRPGGVVGGYTWITDGVGVIFTQPADEVTWAQATEWGNLDAMAGEMAYGQHGYEKALDVACWVHAAAIVAMDLQVDTALRLHQWFSGKWCSAQVLNRNDWSRVVRLVSERAAQIRAYLAVGDGTGGEAPKYQPAAPIAALVAALKDVEVAPSVVYDKSSDRYMIWVGDRVRIAVETPRYRYAMESEKEIVGPPLNAGDEIDVDWIFQTKDGDWWFITPWWTRVRVEDTERVSDIKGSEEA